MQYGKPLSTRLSPELTKRVLEFAGENEINEASVLRLAVKRFFCHEPSTALCVTDKSGHENQVPDKIPQEEQV